MREKYRNFNKNLKKLIKTPKYSYYSKKFVNCNGNMRKTWQIINEIRGKSIRNIKPLFKYKDDIITDKKEIANKFNEYYASMAENMNNSVNDEIDNSRENTPSFQSYMDKQSEDSIYLSDCEEEEVWTTIRNLENGKSSDIPIKLIKNCAPVITPILTKYFNRFMQTGDFPDILKIGKITPIFKKDNLEKFENYRPISTLPIFGKIFKN